MADDGKLIAIEVLRYRPEQDKEPFFQTYQVPFTDEMSVLEGLQYIKDHLDGSLSFRWSCRMAICGSCGGMINGIPKLECKTFLRDYYPGKVRVEPLEHFPIERDLVVNVRDFIAKLERITPYIVPKEPRRLDQGEVPADAGAARSSFCSSAAASTACSVMPPVLSTGSTRPSSGRGARAAAPLQRRFARRRARAADGAGQCRRRRVELHGGGILFGSLPQGRRSGERGQSEQDRERAGLFPALREAGREYQGAPEVSASRTGEEAGK
mgnify:CR=1 FL=1